MITMASPTPEEDSSAVLEVTSEAKTIHKSSDPNHSDTSSGEADGGIIHTPSSVESLSLPRLMAVTNTSSDIQSRVDNPQKVVETWGTYISFRIVTKCSRWGNGDQEFVVRRRYNDFKALRDRLVENSLQIVPPLPCRHTLLAQLDRYSKDFVLQRMALLNIFIRRITTHTILSHDEDLKVFLTASQSELQHHFKSRSGSYLSSISDSLYSLASNNPQTVSRVKDPEFSSAGEYMTSLREKLDFLHSVFTRVNKERTDFANEMVNMRPIFDCWSQTEHFNRDSLKRTNRGINKTNSRLHALGEILKVISSPYVVISADFLKMSKEYPYTLGNPIKEYMLYIDSVKERLQGRDSLQAGLEVAQNKANKMKTAPNSREVEIYHDRLQCASEALRSDLSSWQRQKKTDLKMILLEMAKKHIEVYETALAAWEAVLPATKKIVSPGPPPQDRDFFKQMGAIVNKNGGAGTNWDSVQLDSEILVNK